MGTTRTAVDLACVPGAAVGVNSQEESRRWELALAHHRLPLFLLSLSVAFKDRPVVVAIATDPALARLTVRPGCQMAAWA